MLLVVGVAEVRNGRGMRIQCDEVVIAQLLVTSPQVNLTIFPPCNQCLHLAPHHHGQMDATVIQWDVVVQLH